MAKRKRVGRPRKTRSKSSMSKKQKPRRRYKATITRRSIAGSGKSHGIVKAGKGKRVPVHVVIKY